MDELCEQVGKTAEEYFSSGFNCAEAVSLSVAEILDRENSASIPQVASFFGGGIGSSNNELCGAISGAVIVAGLLKGRKNPDVNVDDNKSIVTSLMETFKARFDTTHCGSLIENLDEKTQNKKCARIVRETAIQIFKQLSGK